MRKTSEDSLTRTTIEVAPPSHPVHWRHVFGAVIPPPGLRAKLDMSTMPKDICQLCSASAAAIRNCSLPRYSISSQEREGRIRLTKLQIHYSLAGTSNNQLLVRQQRRQRRRSRNGPSPLIPLPQQHHPHLARPQQRPAQAQRPTNLPSVPSAKPAQLAVKLRPRKLSATPSAQ